MATITVGPSGRDYTDFQAAIDACASGDTIKLDANVTFTGTYILKAGLTDWVTVTSNALPEFLPATGYRTSPAYATYLPKIQSAGAGATAVQTAVSAKYWRFRHIQFKEVPSGFNSVVTLGQNDSTQQYRSQQPDLITFDQCYVHGGYVCGQKRAFQLNGKRLTVTSCYIERIKSVGQDSQSFQGCNGEGPYVIENNYCSAGTTPTMFGGDDPNIRTYMTVTGSATTTGAAVSCSESGHTLAELVVGQLLAITVSGSYQFSFLTNSPGSGATGTLTWSPALTGAPDNPGSIKAGIVLGDRVGVGEYGLSFRYNHVINDPDWINKTMDTPTSVSAVASTASGSLGAGTKYYKVQAFSSDAYGGGYTFGDLSAEVSATLAATGKITVNYTTDPYASVNRVWRGASAGAQDEWTDSASSPFVDDGTLVWTASGTFGGQSWTIKNLFEIKAAQNWLVERNVFENCWKGSDVGFAVWLKTVNQGGAAPFIKTTNGIFRLNVIRHCYGLFEVHGREGSPQPAPLDGLVIENNLCYDSSSTWGQGEDTKYAIDVTEGALNVTINHNHLIHSSGRGHLSLRSGVDACTGFVYTNNLGIKLAFGIHDNDGAVGEGTAALAACTGSSYTYTKNAIADISAGSYPAGNFADALAAWSAKFTAYAADGVGANFVIDPASDYHNAGTDGADIGCAVATVLAATAFALSGNPADIRKRVLVKRLG